MVKAIFINAKEQTIETLNLGSGHETSYNRIGHGCSQTELVWRDSNDDGLFCDEQGELMEHSCEGEKHFGFLWCVSKINGTFQKYFLICGNGLIINFKENGESRDSFTPLREARKRVIFLSSDAVKSYKEKLLNLI